MLQSIGLQSQTQLEQLSTTEPSSKVVMRNKKKHSGKTFDEQCLAWRQSMIVIIIINSVS